jgi:hypothetical protein
MNTPDDAGKTSVQLLSELMQANLSESPELAAKQRRLLETLAARAKPGEPDAVEEHHQQRMADAVADWFRHAAGRGAP